MEHAVRYSELLIEAVDLILSKKLTFAIYRLPGHQDTTLILQKNHELLELSGLSDIPASGGFLISPFSEGKMERSFIIRPDLVYTNSLQTSDLKKIREIADAPKNGVAHLYPVEIRKDLYLNQIDEILSRIKQGEYEKVVLSRVKNVCGAYTTKLSKIFQLLSESYPQSFVYLFHIKDHCWAGASPEPLLFSERDKLITVSLAGTRSYSEKNLDMFQWNHKEKLEQEYVTRYIERILKEYQVTTYKKIGPYLKKAAQLLHLRTDFIFDADTIGDRLYSLIQTLHPTSAVCGMPKEKSLALIKQIEKHNREYYAGFLGPVGINEKIQLFVNLRCMKVLENQLSLFVGGGITADSVPSEEWDETEIKTETLLSVLNQIH
jgi:isochorismate synthase